MTRRRDAFCVAVLAVVVAILLHDSLFGGKGLVPADGILAYLPWAKVTSHTPSNYLLFDQYADLIPERHFLHSWIRRGTLPLWNPTISCGVPFVASTLPAALFPVNLLLSPLEPFHASGIAAFVKLLLAGVFTLLYMRRLGVGHGAAVVAALAYSLSGFMIVWLGHPHVNAAMWLPLLLYFLECQVQTTAEMGPRLGAATGFAVGYGLMILGGHPPTAIHITLGTIGYLAFRLTGRPREAPVTNVLLFAGALVVGLLLAAPQILPYLEYYGESSSGLASAALERWHTHLSPRTLIHFLLPYVSGGPNVGFEQLAALLGHGDVANFNERTGYLGIVPVFLALVALLYRRCRFTLFYLASLCLCLTIVYGVPPWPSVMRSLPLLNDVNNSRLLLMVDWSGAVLAGLGLDTLTRDGGLRGARGLAIGFGLTVAGVVLGFGGFLGAGFAHLEAPARSFLMYQLLILAGGLLASVLSSFRGARLGGSMAVAICVGWTAFDLLWFATGYNPSIPREQYYPPTDAIRFLQKDHSLFRVLGLGPVLPPNTSAMFDLHDARGQDFTTIRSYEELIQGRAGDFFFYQFANEVPPALRLLSVKYVLLPERLPVTPTGYELVYDGEIAIYRFEGFRERALAVFDYRVETDRSSILSQVRSGAFDPAHVLLLEKAPRVESGTPDAAESEAAVKVLVYEPDRILIEAHMPRPGFLLLLDSYFPGWKAYVDERRSPIYRADYDFRAVSLPAGASMVRFSYEPTSFRLGVGLLVLGLVTLAGGRVVSGARRGRQPTASTQ